MNIGNNMKNVFLFIEICCYCQNLQGKESELFSNELSSFKANCNKKRNKPKFNKVQNKYSIIQNLRMCKSLQLHQNIRQSIQLIMNTFLLALFCCSVANTIFSYFYSSLFSYSSKELLLLLTATFLLKVP